MEQDAGKEQTNLPAWQISQGHLKGNVQAAVRILSLAVKEQCDQGGMLSN